MPKSVGVPQVDAPRWSPIEPKSARKAVLLNSRVLSGIAIAATLALPIPLSVLGAASLAKVAFPILATLLALWLSRLAPARYVAFTLLSFMLAPGLRHFVDWYAGYSKTNLIVLTPYILILVGLPSCFLYLFNRRPYTVIFTAILFVVILGLWMPFLHGNIKPGLLMFVYWICPVIFAIYIVAHHQYQEEIRDTVSRTFLLTLPLMAGYGLWQYVSITPWDAYFLTSAGPVTSMGFPLPFQVRVFGTMNSPGALATVLATGILLVVPRLRGIGWLSLIVALSALLLTTQRAALGGIVVGILVLMFTGRDRVLRTKLVLLAMTAGLTVMVALTIPGVSNKVAGSLGSVSQLDRDESAQQRLLQYKVFPEWLAAEPLGRGLGWSEDPMYVRVGDYILIDSGIIDGFITLGVPGGLLFFATIGLLVIEAGRIAFVSADRNAPAQFAAVMFAIAGLPFGGQELGAAGVFLYLCIGLLLASAPVARLPAYSGVSIPRFPRPLIR